MPAQPIRVRAAQAQDAALLARIGAQAFHHTFGPDNTLEDMAAYLARSFSPEKQAAELTEPGTTFLIAELGEETVGYARLREGPAPASIPARRPIEIVRLYALPAWIGHGVGAALMRSCLDLARRHACDTVWLDVWERNERAISFYHRWGFAEVGTQPFVLGSDIQRDLLMARSVAADGASPGEGG